MLLTVLKYIKTYKVREPVSVYIYSYAPQFHDLFFVKPTRIVQVYFHGYLLMNGLLPYDNSLVHVLRAEPRFQQIGAYHAHHK